MANPWIPSTPPTKEFKKQSFNELSKISAFLYQIGEYPALRQKSHPVKPAIISSREFQTKLTYLRACLRKYKRVTKKGRGIAAVQVGIPEQFLIFYRRGKIIVMINPKIVKESQEKYNYPEICMSANNLIAPVIRPAWVEVEYFDEKGAKQYWQVKGTSKEGLIENRIVQHEIDHLNGIINIDRVDARELTFVSDSTFYANASFKKVK